MRCVHSWNQGNLDALDALYSAGIVRHKPPYQAIFGLAAIKRFTADTRSGSDHGRRGPPSRFDLRCARHHDALVNGVDAARVIQRLAPDLAIVLMSGAIPAGCADHINLLRLAGLLRKPYPLAALRDLIRHAVGDGVAIESA